MHLFYGYWEIPQKISASSVLSVYCTNLEDRGDQTCQRKRVLTPASKKIKCSIFQVSNKRMSNGLSFPIALCSSTKEKGVSTMKRRWDGCIEKISDRFGYYVIKHEKHNVTVTKTTLSACSFEPWKVIAMIGQLRSTLKKLANKDTAVLRNFICKWERNDSVLSKYDILWDLTV